MVIQTNTFICEQCGKIESTSTERGIYHDPLICPPKDRAWDISQKEDKLFCPECFKKEVCTVKHILRIEPAISPRARRKIQDVLEEIGYKIIVGGTATDGSHSNISFKREEPRDKEE